MTAAEAAAADSHNLDEFEEIDPDQASDRDSIVGSKRKGRPVDPAWESFQRLANQNAGATNRAWIGVCMNCNHKVTSGKVDDLRRHAANCSQATPEALSRLNRLIRCRCLTWTLVPLNLVHGVWMSCCDLKTCHVNNRFPRNQH